MSPEDIHRFWFSDALTDPARASQRMAFWFHSNPETDAIIAQRFAPAVRDAAQGSLSDWQAHMQSCLALIIVLDQFPRNIYRGTPAAFEHDRHALGVTRRGIATGHLGALQTVEQAFFLMPFQHVEDLASQREGVILFGKTVNDAPTEWRSVAEGFLSYARQHLEIVERFGRFRIATAFWVVSRRRPSANTSRRTANPSDKSNGLRAPRSRRCNSRARPSPCLRSRERSRRGADRG